MPSYTLTYEAPKSLGQRGVLTIIDDGKTTAPMSLVPTAVVQIDDGVVTQRLDFDPDDIGEVIEAAWFIIRFILSIIRNS